MLALSFASQSTIVAVSSFGVFLNPVVGVRVFHESFLFRPPKYEKSFWKKVFRWDLLNLAITVAGSVCVVLFAPRVPQKEENAFTSNKLLEKWIEMPFVIYFALSVVFVPIMVLRFYRRPTPLNLAFILAILSSFSITLSKVITELIERNDVINLDSFVLICCWVSILLSQIILLQKGLANFEQSGTFSVGGMLGGALTILSGMLFYQTYHDFENYNYVYGFAVGVILLLYGILAFSQRKILSIEEMKKRMRLDLDELSQQPLLLNDDQEEALNLHFGRPQIIA